MTLNDLLDIKDKSILRAQIAFNLNQMKTKYNLTEKDIDIVNNNIFTIYDRGVDTNQIPEDKHEEFLLLTQYNYYNSITDKMSKGNYTVDFTTKEDKKDKIYQKEITNIIEPISELEINIHLKNMRLK
ncbi:MAG: hypothetical protein ACP5N1_04015 [Candidatus Woesearchaeota archaeon]